MQAPLLQQAPPSYSDAQSPTSPIRQQNFSPVSAGPPTAVLSAPPQFSIWSAFSAFSPSGQLAIYPDKAYYVSGEMITGRVMANILQPVTCRAIVLHVEGLEKVEWHERRTEQINRGGDPPRYDSIHYLKRHRGHRHFFNVKIPLYDLQNNALMPGQYTFPFQFQLPDGLPGSFYERRELGRVEPGTIYEDDSVYGEDFHDSDDEAHIRRAPGSRWSYKRPELLAIVNYKLKAVLDVNGFFSPNLYAKQPLIIHPRLNADVKPAFGEQAKDVVVCCCCNYGKCSLKVHFDKNAYCPGEVAKISADVANDSTKELPTTVKLWRTLTLKSSSGRGGHTHTERIIALQQKYDIVPPGEHCQRPMPLSLPEGLKPTTLGSYVQCSYEYAVECNVAWGADIRVSTPVLLYAPQPPEEIQKPLF